MNKEQLKIISENLLKLTGENLKSVTRTGSMGDFGFGDCVEKEVRGFDEKKKIITKIISVPRLALHIDCHFRLSCGYDIILSRGDIFQPATGFLQDESFDYSSFDWDIPGNNRYDEICKKFFANEPENFIVKKVTLSKLGDINISFKNGFLLEISPDISGKEECWRFFEIGSEEHIIVSGQGLELYDSSALTE